jgi:outer membrane lipoprotein-sorting protein
MALAVAMALALAFAAGNPVALAGSDASDPLLIRLQARLDAIKSLKGRFVQSLDSKSLGRPLTEEGRFFMKKPSRMRWDYDKPEVKLAILDGHDTWLYVPADREVYKGAIRDLEQSGAAALLLAGRIRLDTGFAARRLTPEQAGPQGVAGAVAIELKPRRPSEEFDSLILAVDPERVQIRRLTVIDAIGGRMVFDLFDLDEDPVLSDDLFRFTVPAGVEIIENR